MDTASHTEFGKYLVHTNGNHKIYSVPASLLMQLTNAGKLKRWSGNRPEDEKRVAVIKEHLIRTHHVNGTIHLALLSDEGLVCYDLQSRTKPKA